MPSKLATKKKSNPHHTRKDSRLTPEVQGKILFALESGEFEADCNPREIVLSNPGDFGDPNAEIAAEDFKLAKATEDKIRNLRKFKRENPAEHW